MKCFSCDKVPKKLFTLHLKDKIVVLCSNCLESRKVILCANRYNLHDEYDEFAVYINIDIAHCIECFRHEKKILLKKYSKSHSMKTLSSKILEYI